MKQCPILLYLSFILIKIISLLFTILLFIHSSIYPFFYLPFFYLSILLFIHSSIYPYFYLSALLLSLILKETGKHNYEIDEQERENEKFFNNLRNIPAIYSKKSWEDDYQKHVRASSRTSSLFNLLIFYDRVFFFLLVLIRNYYLWP